MSANVRYHFTCAARARRIEQDGYIKPMPQFILGGDAVVWLSDYRNRDQRLAARLAMTGTHTDRGLGCTLGCNPLYARYTVRVAPEDLDRYILPYSLLAVNYPQAASLFRSMHDATPWRWSYSHNPIRLYITEGARFV